MSFGITINLTSYIEEKKVGLRKARDLAFPKLDGLYVMYLEQENEEGKQSIVERKTILRNCINDPRFKSAKTVEQIDTIAADITNTIKNV